MPTPIAAITEGDAPIAAAAIHAGHAVRAALRGRLALDGDARLREEDPFTDRWTRIVPTRIIGRRSRFEVDLNRPRELAVYRTPEQAWGLQVWREPLPRRLVADSLDEYDRFYGAVDGILERLSRRWERFVILDLHTYNHRRDGVDAPPATPSLNPDINIGTATIERERWAGLLDRFIADLRRFPFPERPLDVRENVKFGGGHFAAWVHRHYPGACVISVEVKKFFMDEWTGEADRRLLSAVKKALLSTLPGIREQLATVPGGAGGVTRGMHEAETQAETR